MSPVPGIARWEAWWFPPASGLGLAICRILVVLGQLLIFMPFFLPSPAEYAAMAERPLQDAQWLIRLVAEILPPDVRWSPLVRGVHLVTLAAGVTTLVGAFTRTSAALFALGTWFLYSLDSSYGHLHHNGILISVFLLCLALSPSGRHLSVDALRRRRRPSSPTTSFAVWPMRLQQILLSWSYVSNAVAKLTYGGVAWMNGYTLQQYLLTRSLDWESPFGLWLAPRHGLCVAVSIATILYELAFPLVLLAPRARPVVLGLGVLFHLGIYLTLNVAFFEHVFLYATFIDFERLADRARGRAMIPVLRAA
ncbi:MAG TPA: HTTM domain-containing protein [Gemmatimonadota bacterium]|nr:HTTM domain-containing protein [Gemmatimonadota bacterium]